MHRFALACVLIIVACGDDGTDDSTSGAATAGTDSGSTGMAAESDGSTGGAASSTGGAASSTGAAGSDSTGEGVDSSSGGTGAAAPTWDNFGEEFFETYCWECHGPGDRLRDYSVLSMVAAESNTIRCGTAPSDIDLAGCEGEPPAGQFPIGMNLPGDADRARLVEWIDAGLPEN